MPPSRFSLSQLVQKTLTDRDLNADEVIRKALDIKAEGLSTVEGVFFPEGTALLAWYKDNAHVGRVKEGAIEVNGERYSSVSGAAASITGRPTTNGWSFWMVKLPGKNDFVHIANFRKDNSSK